LINQATLTRANAVVKKNVRHVDLIDLLELDVAVYRLEAVLE
jgi:hypothetical protein